MSFTEELTFTPKEVERVKVIVDEEATDYTVVLGYHGSPADMPSSLRDTYSAADVVLHEQIGWQQQEVDIYNQLSFAPSSQQSRLIEQARPMYFDRPLSMKRLRLVAGTQAGQGFWDLPHSNPAVSWAKSGRQLVPQNDAETDQFISAVIRSDIIALKSIGERIRAMRPTVLKSDRRHVVIHAGLAHLLLYNALRISTEESSSSTIRLLIPFETTGLTLANQTTSIEAVRSALLGVRLDEETKRRFMAVNAVMRSGRVKPAATHLYSKRAWELAAQTG